jgi:hypothetical protein
VLPDRTAQLLFYEKTAATLVARIHPKCHPSLEGEPENSLSEQCHFRRPLGCSGRVAGIFIPDSAAYHHIQEPLHYAGIYH